MERNSFRIYFVDDNQQTVTIREIDLQAVEKTITIKITDHNGNPISDAEITCKSKNYLPAKTISDNQIIFKGEELKERWIVSAKKGNLFSADYRITPENQNEVLSLVLREQKEVKITETDQEGAGHRPPFHTNPTFMTVSIVGIIAIIVVLCTVFSGKPEINKLQIRMYVEGDEFILSVLDEYKTQWAQQKPKISENGGGFLGLLSIDEKQTDSTEYKEWEMVAQWIDKAIEKRKLIDEKNFAELKNLHYYLWPQKIKYVLAMIDRVKYEYVSQQLGDVSELTLTQIADSITAILAHKREANPSYKEIDKKKTLR
jgi:hypothetical protein